jgi:hypothetical protein
MNFGLVGKKKSKDLIESAMLITIQNKITQHLQIPCRSSQVATARQPMDRK